MCTTCSECVPDVYVGVKTHLCNIHTRPCTSVHNTCKVHVTLIAKKCTYIYTYTHMYTHTYAHENTCAHRPHAEALIPRPTIYAQICIHIHIRTCINTQMYRYIHTCIYIHISCPHTYTLTHIYIYIHRRIQNVHMNALKTRLKRRRGSDCVGNPT